MASLDDRTRSGHPHATRRNGAWSAVLLASVLALLASGCATRNGTILAPRGTAYELPPELEQSGAALQQLRRDEGASFHLLHVATRQAPQRYESDVVIFVLHGKLSLDLDGTAFIVQPGDVVEIPRGVSFATVNMGKDASKAYLVMTPAYSGPNAQVIAQPPERRVSSWQRTQWGR